MGAALAALPALALAQAAITDSQGTCNCPSRDPRLARGRRACGRRGALDAPQITRSIRREAPRRRGFSFVGGGALRSSASSADTQCMSRVDARDRIAQSHEEAARNWSGATGRQIRVPSQVHARPAGLELQPRDDRFLLPPPTRAVVPWRQRCPRPARGRARPAPRGAFDVGAVVVARRQALYRRSTNSPACSSRKCTNADRGSCASAAQRPWRPVMESKRRRRRSDP
jgi:hypothetical protein